MQSYLVLWFTINVLDGMQYLVKFIWVSYFLDYKYGCIHKNMSFSYHTFFEKFGEH